MNDDTLKPADQHIEGVVQRLDVARRNTLRIMEVISAKLGRSSTSPRYDGPQWFRDCPVCWSEQTIRLDIRETVVTTLQSGADELTFQWFECSECMTRRRLANFGVPETLLTARLDGWIVQVPADKEAERKAKAFSQRPTGAFIIASPEFGNGKSFLACAILRDWYERKRRPARYITNAGIIRSMRRRYDDSKAEDIIAALQDVPFLVIDDLGASAGGKDEAPALHEILAERYAERLPTVITTNLSPDQFREAIGPRVASRLQESVFAWTIIHGKSMRQARRGEYLGGK